MNIWTTAGETLSKVAAVFEVSRSAVFRHQKHFAERILVGREGAEKVMQDVQTWADKYKLPVADLWRHIGHTKFPDIVCGEELAVGALVLACSGIEPYRSQFLDAWAKDEDAEQSC